MKTLSTIMRSALLDRDFELLLGAASLFHIVDDGFATDKDHDLGLFAEKKSLLATRFQDFKDCTSVFDHSMLQFTKKINRHWGTSSDLLHVIQKSLGRPVSHGALLLALDLRGMKLESIDGRKDAYMSISDRTII